MHKFVGRRSYFQKLESLWEQKRTKIICVYGRRRVGKTALIQEFTKNKRAFLFEALEGESTPSQVRHFLTQLSVLVGEPYLKDLNYTSWPPAFDLLTEKLSQYKSIILCFDELPWMAAGRSKLISYIKFYWDKKWKQHPHLLFILCGSVASWMVKNVVRSKALYGRVSHNFLVKELKPFEVNEFIGNKRGQKEVLDYLICFGGIPRYLEEFDFRHSIQINIEKNCFSPDGFFVDEADKIFYSQFKETEVYKRIINYTLKTPARLVDIAHHLKMKRGGGLKQYLDNLVNAAIIDGIPETRGLDFGKTIRYYLADEFLRFDVFFIKPNLAEIRSGAETASFEKLTQDRWAVFLGLGFERFCVKHRYTIARLLGFDKKVVQCGPVLLNKKDGFQFDLVYLRNDEVFSLCEIKYLSEPPSTKIIHEFERKLKSAPLPSQLTIEKVLICNQTPTQALLDSGYFNQILQARDIVNYVIGLI